jgi:DNA-binding transcriptional LysR family regulator
MDTRSFSRTGRELDLTQPTISGHVKTLEEQVGLQLFDRHRRKVTPTAAALVLYDYAQKILELHRDAEYAMIRFQRRVAGRLKIGGSTIPGSYILPGLIGRFHKLYPDTYISLAMDDTDRMVQRLADGEVETAVVGAGFQREDLHFEPLVEDVLVPVLPQGARLGRDGGTITIDDLLAEPFVVREEGSGTLAAITSALAEMDRGLSSLNVVAEMGSTEAVRQAVREGLGMSIISRVAAADMVRHHELKTASVAGLNLKRTFFLVTHKKAAQSPTLEAFLDFIRAERLVL